MRLCTFELKTPLGRHLRAGAVVKGGIVDLNSACVSHLFNKGEAQPHRIAAALVPSTMLGLLQGERTSMETARAALDEVLSGSLTGPNEEKLLFKEGEVRLRAPLPRPASMRDFYAFERHVKIGFEKRGEPMPAEWYEMPVYYKGNHQSIIGPDEDVHWPSFTQQFDYELELAIIIGKTGRNIPE